MRDVRAIRTEGGFKITLNVDGFGRSIEFINEDMANLLSDLVDVNLDINKEYFSKKDLNIVDTDY